MRPTLVKNFIVRPEQRSKNSPGCGSKLGFVTRADPLFAHRPRGDSLLFEARGSARALSVDPSIQFVFYAVDEADSLGFVTPETTATLVALLGS